jgi:hypothetical protein
MVADTMQLVADDVQTLVILGCGHWVAELGSRAVAGRPDRVPGPLPGRSSRTNAAQAGF